MNLEFEIKYEIPSPEIKAKIIKDSLLINKERYSDSYLDTNDYSLMLADHWLRWRVEQTQSKYWLKFNNGTLPANAYLECELPSDISNILGIRPIAKSIQDLYYQLHDAGIGSRFGFDTIRETYKGHGFTLCFDEVDFGYNVLEVEKLIPNFIKLESVTEAQNSIREFAASMGLIETNLLRKPVEYLRRNQPTIFQKLRTNGFAETGQIIPS